MVNTPSNKSPEGSKQTQRPSGKHLPIGLTARAINHFRDLYFSEGKINAFQVMEVSNVLNEKGPMEAAKKLAQFLKELDQQDKKDESGKADK